MALRDLYKDLYRCGANVADIAPDLMANSRSLLSKLLDNASTEIDMPDSLTHLEQYLSNNWRSTLHAYQDYVDGRNNGALQRMFKDVFHAKWYLVQIAPTKLVDGVWLKNSDSVCDNVLSEILNGIYLDECGNGIPARNYVHMYKNLLHDILPHTPMHNVSDWLDNGFVLGDRDDIFEPGFVQMALAVHTRLFVPELVGYTLGYEEVPLHMMITSYELKELNIDDSYFNVHITVDNPDCGHSRQAMRAVERLLEIDPTCFSRIWKGYRLSQASCAFDLVETYDLRDVVQRMLERKALVSHSLHDTVRISGDHGYNSLGEFMRKRDGKVLLDYLVNNGYFDQDSFEATTFYHLLETRMLGTFTKDEMFYVAAWHENENEKEPNETSGDSLAAEEERVLSLLKKGIRRHQNVILKHPVTGCKDSMTNWWNKGKKDLLLCLSTLDMKQRISKSFTEGKMRSINMDPDDMTFLLDWCRS